MTVTAIGGIPGKGPARAELPRLHSRTAGVRYIWLGSVPMHHPAPGDCTVFGKTGPGKVGTARRIREPGGLSDWESMSRPCCDPSPCAFLRSDLVAYPKCSRLQAPTQPYMNTTITAKGTSEDAAATMS